MTAEDPFSGIRKPLQTCPAEIFRNVEHWKWFDACANRGQILRHGRTTDPGLGKWGVPVRMSFERTGEWPAFGHVAVQTSQNIYPKKRFFIVEKVKRWSEDVSGYRLKFRNVSHPLKFSYIIWSLHSSRKKWRSSGWIPKGTFTFETKVPLYFQHVRVSTSGTRSSFFKLFKLILLFFTRNTKHQVMPLRQNYPLPLHGHSHSPVPDLPPRHVPTAPYIFKNLILINT